MLTLSVVVDDLNVHWPYFGPNEVDSPLVVDADTVLTFSIVLQRLKMVARRGF